jgi:hypothetical protein
MRACEWHSAGPARWRLLRRFEKALGRADRGSKECQKDFPFGREWNGQLYATKQVRSIFIEEPEEILVVTVYVYYF